MIRDIGQVSNFLWTGESFLE